MATENLNIVITADVQDAVNKVKAVKNNITDLGTTVSDKVDLNSAFGEGASATQRLGEQISKLRTAGFLGLVSSIANWRASTKSAAAAQQSAINASKARINELQREYRELIRLVKEYKNQNSAVYTVDGEDWEGPEEASRKSGWAFNEAQDVQKELNAETAKYNGLVAKAGKTGKGAFLGLSGAAAVAAAAIAGVAAVVASLALQMRNALKYSKELRDTFFEARKVGLTTSAYKEFAYVLDQVGVDADKLSDFIKSLSAAQNDLRDGSEGMVNAFKDLGLSVEEAVNMSQEELFVETIKRLQQMEDGIQRTSIAYRIFGEDDAAQVANLMALNNEEMERMINNFYLLGGGASDSAIQKSLELQSAVSSLRLAWQGLGNTLGEAIMPAITAVVNALAKAIAWVNMFLRAVFGLDIVAKSSSSVNKASASVGGYSSSLKKAAGAAEQLKRSTMGFDELNIVPSGKSAAGGSDMGDIGGGGGSFDMPEIGGFTKDLGLDKWAEHFEKFKSAYQTWVPIGLSALGLLLGIVGFATGNLALGAVGVGLFGLGVVTGLQSGAWSKIFKSIGDAIKKALKAIGDFFVKAGKVIQNALKAIGDFFARIGKAIADTAKKVWKAAADFVVNTWEKVKTTVTNIWNAIKTFLTNCWNGIKSVATTVWNAIKTFFTNTWNSIKSTATTIWNAVAKFFSDTWNSIKTTATNAWNAIKTFLTNLWNGIKTTATTIWNAVVKFFKDSWESIKTTATNAWNGIKTMLENTWNAIKTKASELCDKLKEFFSKAWDAIKKVWDVVKGYFSDIWENIKSGASALGENVKNFFINAWNAIKGVWDTVKGYFKDIWDNIKNAASSAVESIKGFFSGAWTAIKNVWSGVSTWFGTVWTGIKNAFSGVGDWFGNIFSGAVTKVKNAWSGIKEWFSGVWSGIKGVFTSAGSAISDGITGALKSTFNSFMRGAVGLINKFINAINSAIGLINKIPGVNISKLSTLSVPQLAKGGIVTDSILANIGERGREAVLPLENNTGWMDTLADRIAARSGPSKIVLQVDGRELGWATIEQINAITKQTGGLQLVL